MNDNDNRESGVVVSIHPRGAAARHERAAAEVAMAAINAADPHGIAWAEDRDAVYEDAEIILSRAWEILEARRKDDGGPEAA